MKKKLFSLFLTFCLVLSLSPVSAFAKQASNALPAEPFTSSEAAPAVEVSTEPELQAAVEQPVWNVKLTRDICLSASLELGGTGTLDGGGHILSTPGQPSDQEPYNVIEMKSGSQLVLRELTLKGPGVAIWVEDWNDESATAVTLERCRILECVQAAGTDGRIHLKDCTVVSPGGFHASAVMAERSVINGMISARDVCIANSVVTGVIFSEYSEEAVMALSASIANSIVLGNYDFSDGEAEPCDLWGNSILITESVVGNMFMPPPAERCFAEIVLNSPVNETAPSLEEVFAELTTVTENGVSAAVPVVDSSRLGLEAIRLTGEWAERLAARSKRLLLVEGYHGPYSITRSWYGVSVRSSIPYTAYFAEEPLSDENYPEKGIMDSFGVSLEQPGRKTVYYYILREGMPPETGSVELVITKADQEAIDIEGRNISFDAATMSIRKASLDFEYSIDTGITWRKCEKWGDCPVSDVTAEADILLRVAETEYYYASPASVVPVEQQEKPAGITVTQPDSPAGTGTISGVTGAMEYSADGGRSWKTGTGRDLVNIPQGTTYLVRTKAAVNALPSEPVAVSIASYGAAAEETPSAGIDYRNEALTGLSGDILIDGTPCTANGPIPIKAGWFGKTVELVQRGNGSGTKDSEAQPLAIAARPAAPTVTAANESYPGAEDGRLGTDSTMEYRMACTADWAACTGEAAGLSAGTYFVRAQSTTGTFASEAAVITVGSDPTRQEETPQAVVSADRSSLENLAENGSYAISGKAYTAGENGKISISPLWRGTTLQIIKKGNGTSTTNSAAQYLDIPADLSYTVTYDMNGGTGSIQDTTAYLPGHTVPVKFTPAPQKPGAVFLGWAIHAGAAAPDYTPQGTTSFLMGTENVILYAVWGPVKPAVTWSPSQPFTDVAAGAWYESAVQFAVDNGLFYGTGEKTFSPNGSMTRGMLAAVLYRLAKEPEATAENPFKDVANGKYYTKAVVWAAERQIAAGYGGNRFGPEDPVTREQLAAILWRYAGSPESAGGLENFTDGGKASDWAIPALRWAVEQKIISGKGNTELDPEGRATRAETAAMLMRYCEAFR